MSCRQGRHWAMVISWLALGACGRTQPLGLDHATKVGPEQGGDTGDAPFKSGGGGSANRGGDQATGGPQATGQMGTAAVAGSGGSEHVGGSGPLGGLRPFGGSGALGGASGTGGGFGGFGAFGARGGVGGSGGETLAGFGGAGGVQGGTSGFGAWSGFSGVGGAPLGGGEATGATAGSGTPGGASGAGGVGGAGGTSGTGGVGGAGGTTGSGGSGGTAVCQMDRDCEDIDPCTTDLCKGARCSHPPRDDDRDGHPSLPCGGDDCNDGNPRAAPGLFEICNDAADNDCNGVADCQDPECADEPRCGCVPDPGGETCTNGSDDDCDTLVDCLDPSCQGIPACGCLSAEVGRCDDGYDDDCNGLTDCEDPACSSEAICICQSTPEDCINGADDDCNLLVDCADPSCTGSLYCACVPPGSPEACDDWVDNDCDDRNDCADPDCLRHTHCAACAPEDCGDGLDNDCDGAVDCGDDSCILDPACEALPERCNNERDDDFDGLVDCNDVDCAANPLCAATHGNCLTAQRLDGSGTYTGSTVGLSSQTEGTCGGAAGEVVYYFVLSEPARVHLDSLGSTFDSNLYVRVGACGTGREIGCDDDGAGDWAGNLDFALLAPGTYYVFVDGFTVDPFWGPNQGDAVLNLTIETTPGEDCGDETDNDGDHHADCADVDCRTNAGCELCAAGLPPSPEFGPLACTDALDNDCDGLTDCDDDDCSASPINTTECCDGTDENGNGIPDDFNCRCTSDADCPGGQVCYHHTTFTCGLPCSAFVGDVCPFESPGSRCSWATEQCEFP